MKLFHFTSTQHVGHILAAGGLNKGTVWTGEDAKQYFSAILLTTDPDPDRAGVDDGVPLQIPPDKRVPNGPTEIRGIDKRRVRFTTVIPTHDRHLVHYWSYLQGRVGQWFLDYEVSSTPGGLKSVKNWFFYRRTIPLSKMTAIEVMDEHDDFVPATREMLELMEPYEVGRSFSDVDEAVAYHMERK